MFSSVVDSARFLADRVPLFQRALADPTDLKRLLRLECEYNREILRCARLDESEVEQRDAGLILLAGRLQTAMLEAALGDSAKANKLFGQLSALALKKSPPLQAETITGAGCRSGDTAARKLEYLFVAVRTLQAVAPLLLDESASGSAALRNVRIRSRMKYLETAYRTVSKALARPD